MFFDQTPDSVELFTGWAGSCEIMVKNNAAKDDFK